MRLFISYSQEEFSALEEKTKDIKGGLPSLVTRAASKLAAAPVSKRCKNKCKKVRRGYELSDEVAEQLKKQADNEGISVCGLVYKKIVVPLVIEAYATTTIPPEINVAA